MVNRAMEVAISSRAAIHPNKAILHRADTEDTLHQQAMAATHPNQAMEVIPHREVMVDTHRRDMHSHHRRRAGLVGLVQQAVRRLDLAEAWLVACYLRMLFKTTTRMNMIRVMVRIPHAKSCVYVLI
jgi:hypothetical protein